MPEFRVYDRSTDTPRPLSHLLADHVTTAYAVARAMFPGRVLEVMPCGVRFVVITEQYPGAPRWLIFHRTPGRYDFKEALVGEVRAPDARSAAILASAYIPAMAGMQFSRAQSLASYLAS